MLVPNRTLSFPGVQVVKNTPANAGDAGRRCRFNPWVRKIFWKRKWLPLRYSCLGNPMDRGTWQATAHRVTESRTGLTMCPHIQYDYTKGFPCGSAGKESACNAGDLGSIPTLGRSPGEGKGYPPTPVCWPGEFHGQLMGSQRVRHD